MHAISSSATMSHTVDIERWLLHSQPQRISWCIPWRKKVVPTEKKNMTIDTNVASLPTHPYPPLILSPFVFLSPILSRQVVERIKAVPNETKLLVLDIAGDEWYKEKGIVVKVTQENVIFMKTPVAEEPQKEHIPESSHNGKGIDQITEEQQQRLHGKEQETTSTVTTTTRREETPVVSANSGANVVSANSGANCSRKTPHDQAEHVSCISFQPQKAV